MNELTSILQVFREKDHFLITSHINPDGDSISGELALANLLQRIGRHVTIVNENPVPEMYRFLPNTDSIRPYPCEPSKFQVSLILDCNEWERVGKVAPLAMSANLVINIDHHLGGTGLGRYNYIDTEASSIAEQIYKIANMIDVPIDYPLALYLYVGILTDTGCFKEVNTTSLTHKIVADLLSYGISPKEVFSSLYENNTKSFIELLGHALTTSKVTEDGKISWIIIPKNKFQEVGVNPEDLDVERIIDQIRSIKGVTVSCLFRELDNERIKINFRGKGREIDVSKIAARFGGGGHRLASSCIFSGSIAEAERRVIDEVKRWTGC
ncbi:MAG: bifunctional oligoribonuclease/PAP phosphatase NrnA [bacterium]|nr:bifunctional oligoribonuclease/PAP phosphatase NrnA [bacterium]